MCCCKGLGRCETTITTIVQVPDEADDQVVEVESKVAQLGGELMLWKQRNAGVFLEGCCVTTER
jgi:hypothetical protein